MHPHAADRPTPDPREGPRTSTEAAWWAFGAALLALHEVVEAYEAEARHTIPAPEEESC